MQVHLIESVIQKCDLMNFLPEHKFTLYLVGQILFSLAIMQFHQFESVIENAILI